MTMNEYMHRDHLRDLWVQIDKLHLSYLQTDENIYRIEQKHKLESYIREYLCLAPHNRKFCFQETANVLHQSASAKETFSAYRAASAWDALGTYAANLLSQPWRKEYRVLKMYCGFYKHEIEANLVGAEVMLEAMGYKHMGNTTMILEGPIDPDRVSNVSRDSLMAAVECQLLKAIWEEVSRRFQCHWLDILEFRENHVCSPEIAVKGLMYQFHQREYQEQHQQQMAMYHHQMPTSDNYGTTRFHHPSQGCLYGQISPTVATMPPMGYYNYSPYALGAPHPYTLPSQPRYGSIMSPQQQMMSCPMPAPAHPTYFPAPVQPVLKSQDIYPPNGHATMDQYQAAVPVAPQPPVPTQAVQMTLHNGYALQNQINPVQSTGQNYGCLVPTGQLIELDAVPAGGNTDLQQTHSATDSSSSVLIPRTIRQHQNHQPKKSSHEKQEMYTKHNENSHASNYLSDSSKTEQTSRKSKDEGTGTFESWDYVFRNLESQGYNKDLGERPDILSPVDNGNTNLKGIGESRGFRNKETEALDLEDTLMEMRLEEMQRKMKGDPSEHRTMKINEALLKMKLDSDADMMRTKHQVPSEPVGSSASVYDNLSSPPKEVTSVQRPRTEASKGISVAAKTNTKTLLREPKKHENKRLVNSSHYSSATLDPRQLTERNNLGATSASCVEKSEGQADEKIVRRNSIQKNRNCDVEKLDRTEATLTDGNVGKWECVTCTFHNNPLRDICEMCGKSKVRGPESRPLASGGRECPQCTLVNEKDVGTCVACDCSLKDSPTYI